MGTELVAGGRSAHPGRAQEALGAPRTKEVVSSEVGEARLVGNYRYVHLIYANVAPADAANIFSQLGGLQHGPIFSCLRGLHHIRAAASASRLGRGYGGLVGPAGCCSPALLLCSTFGLETPITLFVHTNPDDLGIHRFVSTFWAGSCEFGIRHSLDAVTRSRADTSRALSLGH